MRIGLVYEKKIDFPFLPSEPDYINSDLLSAFEEDELISGLRDAGHDVDLMGDGMHLLNHAGQWRDKCDIVFNRSVGYRGMDRKSWVPGVLEIAQIPYVGSGPYIVSLTRHKYHAKLVVGAAGIPTAPAVIWAGPADTANLSRIPYPAIVKPIAESCSIGISAESIVDSPTAAADRGRWLCETLKQPALIEQFISGVEIEVPLVGWPELEVCAVVGVTLAGAQVRDDMILSGDSVYGDAYGFTAEIEGVDLQRVAAVAARAAKVLDIRDYGRVDLRVAADGTPYFIEATTHPHVLKHSSFFHAARTRGLDYPAMLAEIVATTARRCGLQSSQNSMSQMYQGMR